MNVPDSITKAPVIFLTGAGASAPLGLHPTREFLEYFKDTPLRKLSQGASREVAEVALQTEILATEKGMDIERILSRVESTIQAVEHLTADSFVAKTVLGASGSHLTSYKMALEVVRELIYDEVISEYSRVDVDRAAELYRDLFVDYRKWLGGIPRVGTTVPLFTLNYDIAVEVAASQLGVRLVDGLREVRGAPERRWSAKAFEDYHEDAEALTVILLKLHGSVRWGRQKTGSGAIVELPVHVGRDPGEYRHVVLYPSELTKPMHLEPFRTPYRIFRECLNSATVLFVVGCSLRDQEIRTSISDGMDDNPSLHLVLIGPESDHVRTATELQLDASRVSAVGVRFGESLAGQSGNAFMGLLRGFADSAVGGGSSNAEMTFRYNSTYPTWPWQPSAQR